MLTIFAYVTLLMADLTAASYIRKTGIFISFFKTFQRKILTHSAAAGAYFFLFLATLIAQQLSVVTENTWDKV